MSHAHDAGLGLTAYLGLGANVGDREATILRAAGLLESEGVGRSLRLSSLYESEPVDCAPMEDFVNAVVQLETLLCAEDLLERLQELERRLGRAAAHNEPRRLDIDIIALGNRLIRSEGLTVPHPRYRRRAFVLVPLQEIAPAYRCPETGLPIDDLVAAAAGRGRVTRISSRRVVSAREFAGLPAQYVY